MSDVGNFARPDESGLPETVAPGSVLLVTGPIAPAVDGACLQLLHRYAAPDDVGIVVTTTTGVEETVAEYASITRDCSSPQLGVVDTASRGQNLTAFHREVPTVFTPGPADLARVAVAIDNLEAQLSSSGVAHLVVRSVTSFFEDDDSTSVTRGIERTFGHWSEDGLVVLGVDFTAVETDTMAALTNLADAVVRITVTDSGGHRLEYRGTPHQSIDGSSVTNHED